MWIQYKTYFDQALVLSIFVHLHNPVSGYSVIDIVFLYTTLNPVFDV